MSKTLLPYIRTTHYYETDKMAVAHHANYIKWLEETRVDFLNKIGVSFTGMETQGIFSPVVKVTCQYKSPIAFDDKVQITAKISVYTGVRMTFSYEIFNLTKNKLSAIAESEHCFVNSLGKLVNLTKTCPKEVLALINSKFSL